MTPAEPGPDPTAEPGPDPTAEPAGDPPPSPPAPARWQAHSAPTPNPVEGSLGPRWAPSLAGRPVRPWWLAFAGFVAIGLVVNLTAVTPPVLQSRPPPSVDAVAPLALASPSSGPSGAGPAASLAPSPSLAPVVPAGTLDVYAATGPEMLAPASRGSQPRVYVPDEVSGDLFVIDPATFQIVDRYHVGASAQHVTPDWDLQRLYVECVFEGSGRIAIVDPLTGKAADALDVLGPYNLYFTLDGSEAIVVVDRNRPGTQLYFYDRATWQLKSTLNVPHAGADHMDLTADGRYGLVSTEYDGWLEKVDLASHVIAGELRVGGKPTDVRLAPSGKVFFVANQARMGVSVVNPETMQELQFIRTDTGAHGLAFSRDHSTLYVTNRDAGTLSLIDVATLRVTTKWRIGGSPDMISVSPGGSQLWISNRYSWYGSVSVVDASSGAVLQVIRTGGQPHGLAYWPQPGGLSLGHNGNMR